MTYNQKLYEILADLLYNVDVRSAKVDANSDKAISLTKLLETFISNTTDEYFHDSDCDKIVEVVYNISTTTLNIIRKEYLMNNDYRNAMKALCESLNLSADITEDFSNKFSREMFGESTDTKENDPDLLAQIKEMAETIKELTARIEKLEKQSSNEPEDNTFVFGNITENSVLNASIKVVKTNAGKVTVLEKYNTYQDMLNSKSSYKPTIPVKTIVTRFQNDESKSTDTKNNKYRNIPVNGAMVQFWYEQ